MQRRRESSPWRGAARKKSRRRRRCPRCRGDGRVGLRLGAAGPAIKGPMTWRKRTSLRADQCQRTTQTWAVPLVRHARYNTPCAKTVASDRGSGDTLRGRHALETLERSSAWTIVRLRPTRTRWAHRPMWWRRSGARPPACTSIPMEASRACAGARRAARRGAEPDHPRQRRRRADPAAGARRLRPGDEVVVPHPSFEPTQRGMRSGAASSASLSRATTPTSTTWRPGNERTKAIFVCSPHNPATTIVRKGPLARSSTLSATNRRWWSWTKPIATSATIPKS